MEDSAKKIIVADDHETSVMYLSILLKRMGYVVLPAKNGQQVLEMLATVSPEAVILDGHMPIMNGLATLKAIKGDPALAEIPVVMVTAHYTEQSHEEYRRHGCAGYLTKPVDLMKLNRVLQDSFQKNEPAKRKRLRFAYNHKVQVTHAGEASDYFALTLSEGGIYLRSQSPLPVGTEVSVAIDLDGEETLELAGQVIYHKGTFAEIFRVDPGMAVEFRGISNENTAKLRGFVAKRLAGDLIDEQSEQVLTIEGQAD